MNKYLIDLLKQTRLQCGMTQKEVAELLGIKDNTLSNWEKGRTEPDIDTFIRLCNIYKVSSTELLERSYQLDRQVDDFQLNMSEFQIIKKYRSLDQRGQQAVQDTLDRELGYSAHQSTKNISTDMLNTIEDVNKALINQTTPTSKK